ncbi:hypothetical protein [Streptomyces violascens]|uniref:hypothetical protein n=1 Tax=Streptomyces violascens TaxID=67381 RepID=UPI0019B9B726|nr:hypothetical protein [Streptomyces violascens]GGU48672.1 hypothetical protein GCM10010289_81460 [Streptomyces violascens]
MAETGDARPAVRRSGELRSVNDLLEQVRARPGVWVRRGSLQHLDSMLAGYRTALEVHGVDEELDVMSGAGGPFAEWLWGHLGMAFPSELGWAVEIERAAGTAGRDAMELFFEFLDEFRAERGKSAEGLTVG